MQKHVEVDEQFVCQVQERMGGEAQGMMEVDGQTFGEGNEGNLFTPAASSCKEGR